MMFLFILMELFHLLIQSADHFAPGTNIKCQLINVTFCDILEILRQDLHLYAATCILPVYKTGVLLQSWKDVNSRNEFCCSCLLFVKTELYKIHEFTIH